GSPGFDQSSGAQKMMRGEENYDSIFTFISLPFSSPTPMKGAYICLDCSFLPEHLLFTFTSSKSEKISKKYDIIKFQGWLWFFLPIDLSDVVLCEITGKGREKEWFVIRSLVFFQEDTPDEIMAREAKEKLWSEAPVLEPYIAWSITCPDDFISIRSDDPRRVNPLYSMVKCKNNVFCEESVYYDQSSQAQKMLKWESGECGQDAVLLSHISIPFPSPSPLKCAYSYVTEYCSPSLLFTFTDCTGKKTSIRYDFSRPIGEWYYLYINLPNVVLCEIEGKGMWDRRQSSQFCIDTLVFIKSEELEAASECK
ncbi:hypothetical protein ADUPG1_000066, partial [Aduncisulcus paluster]